MFAGSAKRRAADPFAGKRLAGRTDPSSVVTAKPSRHRAPAPPRLRRREVSVVAVLFVIGVLSVWARHSLSTERPASPITAAAPPVTSAASATSPPVHAQLRAWLARSQPSIDSLLTARREIASAAANNDIAATGATCERADGAVTIMQQSLPSPDPALNTAFGRAIDSYHVGLRHCIAGAHNNDGDDMGQAAAYIRRANAELQAAVDLIESQLPDSEPRDTGVVTV